MMAVKLMMVALDGDDRKGAILHHVNTQNTKAIFALQTWFSRTMSRREVSWLRRCSTSLRKCSTSSCSCAISIDCAKTAKKQQLREEEHT